LVKGDKVYIMLYEVECVDKVSKQVMVSRRVTSFALAREIARHLATAVGSRVIVRQCKPDAKYDVWLWHIEHRQWVRLGGRPMKKMDSAEFFVRFEREDAVPVFWPVGVSLPSNQK
jgi:hypothetical protein